MKISWLASYPKSGNTWVRFLLYNALYAPPKHSLDIARRFPDIHRPIPFDQPDDARLVCKTHFAYSPTHPKIDETDRAVLIIRDPRDVLFSTLNYRRLSGLTTEQMSDETFAQRFIATQGDPEFKAIGFGTWFSHIQSWQNQTRFPVETIRYEDLKASPAQTLSTIASFLGYTIDDAAINAAVKASSFDSMRALEIREKHTRAKNPKAQSLFVGTDASRHQRTYFMNTGKTAQSLASISPNVEQAFNATFAPLMQPLGYTI